MATSVKTRTESTVPAVQHELERLIRSEINGRFFVREISMKEARDIYDHRAIVAALLNDNAEGVGRVLAEHILKGRARLLRTLE